MVINIYDLHDKITAERWEGLRYSPREIVRAKLVITDTAFLLDHSVVLAVVESVSLEELRTGETPQHF